MSASTSTSEPGLPRLTRPRLLAEHRATSARLAGPALGLAVAGLLIASVVIAGGGLQLKGLTVVEVCVDVLSGALCAAALIAVAGAPAMHLAARIAIAAFALLAAFTGLSLIWGVDPSGAWIEANRTFALLATFVAGVALARLAPGRWRAILGGILTAAALVSLYALLTKAFPATLAKEETYARLREPFEYWNAVGLLAALGVPICLWLGARREGHGAVNALAFPCLTLLLLTILVAYSRGALLAVLVGCALWFWIVPLRLRGALLAIPASLVAVLMAAWTFTQDGLDKDKAPLWQRSNAGDEFGVLLLSAGALMLVVGLVVVFRRQTRAVPEPTRRAWGTVLLVVVALVPVGAAGLLASTERGLGGSISHAWNSLTNPDATTPPNDPSRLTAVGSVRARYWREAIDIFSARPVAGVGAGGYATARTRFRRDSLEVRHAHGYLVQTAADLGSIGLALSLALLAAWIAAAAAAVGGRRAPRAWSDPAERSGLITLATVVVVFGVHSFVDWTWFIPGTAVPAMLAAGWVTGRARRGGALGATTTDRRLRAAAAVLVAAAALTAAWSATQPQRASTGVDDALAALAAGQPDRAHQLADAARRADPLALAPLFTLSQIERVQGRTPEAGERLQHAIQLGPSNPETWLRFAEFELTALHDPSAAKRALRPALYLDPQSTTAQGLFLEADRRQHAKRK